MMLPWWNLLRDNGKFMWGYQQLLDVKMWAQSIVLTLGEGKAEACKVRIQTQLYMQVYKICGGSEASDRDAQTQAVGQL